MNAIERLRAGIGAGDRLIPNTMSQEEADALEAIRALDALYQAAKIAHQHAVRWGNPFPADIEALAAAVSRIEEGEA